MNKIAFYSLYLDRDKTLKHVLESVERMHFGVTINDAFRPAAMTLAKIMEGENGSIPFLDINPERESR